MAEKFFRKCRDGRDKGDDENDKTREDVTGRRKISKFNL